MSSSLGSVVAQPSHGYPKEIFDKQVDKKFHCNRCGFILRDPVQSYCGHRFCMSCIESVVNLGEEVHCQTCIEEGIAEEDNDFSLLKKDQMFPDNAVRREMTKLNCHCINPGCNWNGIFKNYENHVRECQFKPVACDQCSTLVPLANLQEHKQKECPRRIVRCKFCTEELLPEQVEEHNSSKCPKYLLQCPSCGKKKIPREAMENHEQLECTKKRVTCPVCNTEHENHRFAHHFYKENPEKHMGWIFMEITRLSREVNNSVTPVTSQQDLNILMTKIQELQQSVGQQEDRIQAIAGNRAGSGSGLSIADVQPLRNSLQTLEVKTSTFESIVATLHREIERCITALEAVDRQRRTDRELLEASDQKIRVLERTLAVKDIAIAEQDLRIQSLELASYDGTLLWRISDYKRKRTDAVRGKVTSLYSPSFYTSRTGYKMCARLYPNGDGLGKSTHISMFFVLQKGYNDALLQWPFQHRVSFMMIDQNNKEHVIDSFRPDPNSSSFMKPTSEMNIASGCPMFLPLSRLDDLASAYVKDDCMYVKVMVDLAIGNTQQTFLAKQ